MVAAVLSGKKCLPHNGNGWCWCILRKCCGSGRPDSNSFRCRCIPGKMAIFRYANLLKHQNAVIYIEHELCQCHTFGGKIACIARPNGSARIIHCDARIVLNSCHIYCETFSESVGRFIVVSCKGMRMSWNEMKMPNILFAPSSLTVRNMNAIWSSM